MKKLGKLIGKLLLSFIATGAISFISMMIALSAEIDFIYKILIGFLFVAFVLVIAWNCARNAGEDDTKHNDYFAARGFFAGALTMLPAIALSVIYMLVSFKGWEGDRRILADGLYIILYLIFLSFTPMLSSLVTFNPALSIDIAQPAITVLKNITTPNAVSAPLFFVPIAAFVIAAGVGYIMGHKDRTLITDAIKRVKNQQNN